MYMEQIGLCRVLYFLGLISMLQCLPSLSVCPSRFAFTCPHSEFLVGLLLSVGTFAPSPVYLWKTWVLGALCESMMAAQSYLPLSPIHGDPFLSIQKQ